MEELYDNLDNYEDHKIIEELKRENSELKSKLEMKTIAMDKLQQNILQEFDKVSAEFKNLEMNYSSLLKTAKVEIERKTKIIQDLNVEKDMVVLKALQNRNQLNVRALRSITKPFEKGPMNDSTLAKKNIPPVPDNLKGKCDTAISGRKEENRFSSVDTIASSNTDINERLQKLSGKNPESSEPWSDRTSDTKENIAKKDVQDSSSTNSRALSIKNRRKSMPAVRSETKFSSDEEDTDTYHRNEPFKKSYLPRDETRQNVERVHSDRYRHKGLEERSKASETSSVDDRYTGYEANRDSYYRNRSDKYGIDKYRPRDRYDNTQRHRRYLSPDRSRRSTRTEDYYKRQEYGRNRYLESPPPDKFLHYQQRNRESRSKHEREDPFECDRRDRQQDKFPAKHKIVSETYEEPAIKKQRTDSFSKFPEDEKRWIRDKGIPLEKSVSDLLGEMPQYTSCQSPDDYLISDESSPLPTKEIMNTASTPLEDPRTQSKKYILKSHDHNAELTTIIGRNVDLKMVDLSKWGMNKSEVPKLLATPPASDNENIIKDLYMDIDNPVSNMSTESGEILTCNEEEVDDVRSKSQLHSSTQRPDVNAIKKEDNKTELASKDSLPTLKSSYRIPKIKSNNTDKLVSNTVTSKIEERKHVILKSSTDDRSRNRKLSKPRVDRDVDKISVKENKDEDKIRSKFNKNNHSRSSLKLKEDCEDTIEAAKKLVADDLELSDETCDNVEMHVRNTENDTIKPVTELELENKIKTTIVSEVSEPSVMNKESKTKSPDTKISSVIRNESNRQTCKKVSLSLLKVKDPDPIDNDKHSSDKKVKGKKDKKTKFNELFGGDSNSVFMPGDVDNDSLITPADLGITGSPIKNPAANYIPMCEDAQDAVDVAVSGKAKADCLSLDTLDKNEIVENQNNTEKHTKSKTKSAMESKKRKSRKSESECIVDVPLPQSSCQNLIVSDPGPPAAISPIEPQPQNIAEATEVDNREPVEKPTMTKMMQLKSDGLMQALATSTPHKGQLVSDVAAVPSVVEPEHSVNEDISVDSAAADASSTAPLKEADVPDVRIFVKRRRKVIKKS